MTFAKNEHRKHKGRGSLDAVFVSKDITRRVGMLQKRKIRVLDNINISVRQGEVVGLVGESGSGKTTLARLLAGIDTPTDGEISISGRDLGTLSGVERREVVGSGVGMVFQDPRASLNRRLRIDAIIEDPMIVHRQQVTVRKERVRELLDSVGLPAAVLERRPAQLSGGQLQRVAIARALTLRPAFLIADEPTSALDVSVQAQVLNALVSVRERYDFGMLLVSHDIRVVRFLSDWIAVMYLGRIVEYGPTEQVYNHPIHPYTRALLSASPGLTSARRFERIELKGTAPHPSDRPSGCPVRDRCPFASDRCATDPIPLVSVGAQHRAWCNHPNVPDSETSARPSDSASPRRGVVPR